MVAARTDVLTAGRIATADADEGRKTDEAPAQVVEPVGPGGSCQFWRAVNGAQFRLGCNQIAFRRHGRLPTFKVEMILAGVLARK